MPIEVARYQFQSWVRKGIATQINEQDVLGNGAATLPAGERPTVSIGVTINSNPLAPKPFALIGPADIIGIHRDMIVRTEPRSGTVNFEPNYLAFIEFYDEDFPWRYSPAKPDGQKLRPWISLLVLKEGEFTRDDRRVPLPVVTVKAKESLPRADETWMFAHAHLERPIPDEQLSSLEKYLLSLQQILTTDPDQLYSRLMSPRHLDPDSKYHAFLVPTFEGGRLTGLGKSTKGVPAQKAAWDATTGVELPFYFDWTFTTGAEVDFELLVEIIEPRVLDKKVGIRSMDCTKPGFVRVDSQGRLQPVGDSGLPAPDPEVQGLEGALKTDRTESQPPGFTPNAFQAELQVLVNLPETITADLDAPPGSDADILNDPVVTLPFYGQNHARQHKTDKVLLDVNQDGWYHDLNRDPRTRVAAGLGTRVIQKNQEKLMQRAWQQVQRVHEANRVVRGYRFTTEVALQYSKSFFQAIAPVNLIATTALIHAKVLGSPTTIRQQLLDSPLRAPVFSNAFRRLTRPAGKLAQRLNAAGTPLQYGELVEAVNTRRVDPAPPRKVPVGLPSVDDLADQMRKRIPEWLQFLIRHRNALPFLLLALLLVAAFSTGTWMICATLAVAAVAANRWLARQAAQLDEAAILTDPVKAREAIQAIPPRPDFNVQQDGETTTPVATPGPQSGGDSIEAANFRSAALQLQERLAIRAPQPAPLVAFDLRNGYSKLLRAVDPAVSYPRRLSALVKFPNLSFDRPEEIVEAMAAPDFEDAMYAHLSDISKELLIPNLDLIPPNTIGLLQTNPKFIESYMVGLNHEMARELLWREYPTDMRGSYFRQFWEVKGISNPDTPTDAELLKDITKLHTWLSKSLLGTHKPMPPSPPPPGVPPPDVKPGEKQLVLVIWGELLKRYPNTVIHAQKAVLNAKGERVIDTHDLTLAEFDIKLKFPLFRAEIDPDLRFFGFDLTIDKAGGKDASNAFPNDHEGWFFVIQEVPGEPRFGMDINYTPTRSSEDGPILPDTWNNLAWDLFGAAEPRFVSASPPPRISPAGPQKWAANAADMAFILFQTPVMVAVHASEMLEKAADVHV